MFTQVERRRELVSINLAKLKELRVEKGFTQKDMAEKLGYKGKSGYCQLENGAVRITLEQAKKIAEILGDDIEKIFFKLNT